MHMWAYKNSNIWDETSENLTSTYLSCEIEKEMWSFYSLLFNWSRYILILLKYHFLKKKSELRLSPERVDISPGKQWNEVSNMKLDSIRPLLNPHPLCSALPSSWHSSQSHLPPFPNHFHHAQNWFSRVTSEPLALLPVTVINRL